MPFFQALGLDLTAFYPATLNLNLQPWEFVLQQPAFTFRQVHWTTAHPPEDFSFSGCVLVFHGIRYDGWVYYPTLKPKPFIFRTLQCWKFSRLRFRELATAIESPCTLTPERFW
ncbi:MAG TPA: hypothetical protein V6D18_01810 [Thermosynechococcaceae cyanobacterium]